MLQLYSIFLFSKMQHTFFMHMIVTCQLIQGRQPLHMLCGVCWLQPVSNDFANNGLWYSFLKLMPWGSNFLLVNYSFQLIIITAFLLTCYSECCVILYWGRVKVHFVTCIYFSRDPVLQLHSNIFDFGACFVTPCNSKFRESTFVHASPVMENDEIVLMRILRYFIFNLLILPAINLYSCQVYAIISLILFLIMIPL